MAHASIERVKNVSADLDIDGLHHRLEEAPNDQDALNALISFYDTEGASKNSELYLSQLKLRPKIDCLYTSGSDLMRQHLGENENARLVTLEGLEEFAESPTLLAQLRALSVTPKNKTNTYRSSRQSPSSPRTLSFTDCSIPMYNRFQMRSLRNMCKH